MKRNRWLVTVCGLLVSVGAGLPEAQGQQPPQEADPAAMEELWRDFATPGPEHEMFRHLVGDWKTVVVDYMSNPGQPAASDGKATFTLILGGRYLQQEYSSSFQGAPFQGVGITGYDKAQKQFVGAWFDTMGTGILNSIGKYDAATQTMHETAEMVGPSGTVKMKMVTQHKSPDKMVFTIYLLAPEGEQKTMEITYTR